MSITENITDTVERLTDLKTTCTICLTASIALLSPVVVTSWLSKEKRDLQSKVTTGFLASVILMSATVLLGSIVDYRIPNPVNEMVAPITHITLMSHFWCKTQAIMYARLFASALPVIICDTQHLS